MNQPHDPEGWDHWSRAMSNNAKLLRKDATFVPEVRSPTVRRRELGALLRKLRTEKGLTVRLPVFAAHGNVLLTELK